MEKINQSNCRKNTSLDSATSQNGVVAIEFALLFLIFFVLFYAIVTYATTFLLQTSFHYAASEGARSAISVDRQSFANDGEYLTQGLTPKIRETVGQSLQWLPSRARDQVLGANNNKIEVEIVSGILTVRVSYPNYAQNPLIPPLPIPGFDALYAGNNTLQGTAILNLS